MATGYIRQDTGNNIENDEIADATYLDLEYDAIQAAFHATAGHAHDGTTGGGGPILSVGPATDPEEVKAWIAKYSLCWTRTELCSYLVCLST